MGAALSIVFGCLLLIGQSFAMTVPHSVEPNTSCQCCTCDGQACSLPHTAPAPASPTPAQVQRAAVDAEKLVPVRNPVVQPRSPSIAFLSCLPPEVPEVLQARPLPLYRQHCLLLI